MDSKDREELCNTGPDEETVAREKKRSRRVSFADITSVHVFDRDEDYETPPDSKPSTDNPELGQSNEAFEFHRDFGGSDDSKELAHNEENDDEDDEDHRELFVRDMDSSSPGSAIGSATSMDEDNFFGPVSASFIRSGRLSDSAASDGNHDITMDSTTFSMHFRSLVQSDSGGNFKTPTGVLHTFEEKTPTENSMPSNSGSFMVLTGVRKPISCASASGGKSSVDSDSNDMSLIESNPQKYDYGRLSPTLNALLAEGSKNIHAVSVVGETSISKSSNYLNRNGRFPMHDEHKTVLMEWKDSEDTGLGNIVTQDTPIEVVSDGNIELLEASDRSVMTPINQISYNFLFSTKDTLPADASSGLHTQALYNSAQGKSFGLDNELGNGALESSERKLEFSGCKSDTVTPLNNKHQINLIKNHDSGGQDRFQDIMREESPNGERYTPIISHNTNQSYGSPAKGSVSSLCAKRQQIFLDSSVSAMSERVSTPFARKLPCSFSNNENISHNESISSIQKSISKFKVHEVSSSDAMLEVGTENSKPALSDHLSNPAYFATILNENREDPNLKEVGVSVTGSEEHLSSVGCKNNKKRSTTEMERCVVGMSKTIRISEESVANEHNEECSYHISSGVPCNEQPSNFTVAMAPSFWFSESGKDMQQYPLTSHDPIEGALVTTESDSTLIGITIKENNQITSTPGKFIHSSPNRLEHKSSASPELLGTTSKLASVELRQDLVDRREKGVTVSHSTPIAASPIKLGSSVRENGLHATMPFLNANGSLNVGKSKGVDFKEFLYNKFHKESGNTGEYRTPLRDWTTLNSQSGSSDFIFRTSTDPSKFKEKGLDKASLYESASPFVRKRTATATRLENRLVERVVQDPSRKEAHNLSGNDSMHPFAEKDPLPTVTIHHSNGHDNSDFHQGFQISHESFSLQDVDGSGRKRKIEEIKLIDKDNIDEIGMIQKNPKNSKENEGDMLEFHPYLIRNNEVENIGGYASLRHWENVFSKLSGATKGLLLPSVDKLNSQELDVLDDLLGRLQMTKKYEKLCTDIQSQRTHDHLSILRLERVVEARWLQQKLVYEHAKLQLLLLKQERLRKRVQLVQSGIQESQKLKFSSLQNVCMLGAIDAQHKDNHLSSLSVDIDSKNEDAYNKLIKRRKDLGALDKKVKNLTKSLHAYCELKGEPSPSETIELASDHLSKRTRCRLILQESQLWKVDNLESKNGHHNLVLNYCHFLLQRFTIDRSVSNMVTFSKLNDATIMKSFPNINACTAFAFVFNTETARKLGSSKSLVVGTQTTSSLLGNLLDVVDEVQIACAEIRNLIHTSFHSPRDEQLELQLCFIEFKTGNKMTLTLDMTCLNCGVYPSEIIPHIYVSQTLESLSAEILAAVGSLKAGHSRIIRLCRCVSQVVQAWCE